MTEQIENPALQKAPVRKFTRATLHKAKPLSKEIEDLEWQLKFSRMKLNKWTDLENEKWIHLREFHATKLAELAEFKAV